MADTTYTVSGMTCDHCAHSVEEEIRGLGGVTAVTVELATGAVTVSSSEDLSVADVRGAVEEAGYELT
jgi:copper chaperone CopZ